MPLVVPNGAEVIFNDYVVGKVASTQPLTLRLYKSNTTPAETDVAATYTEADFSGYAAAPLTGASWTGTPGDPTVHSYAEQTFTSDANQAAQVIYGYYLTRTTGGELMWVERFGSSFTVSNLNDKVKVTPRLEHQT